MNSMESSLVVDQSFSPGKQMKKTPQNVNHPPHYNLHQTGGGLLLSRNIPRQSSNLSQNYATPPPPQVMHEYDKMMMMTMMMHGGFYLNNHHHHLTNSFPPQVMHGPLQPPLLPLPPAVSRPAYHSQPPLRRSQSLSPPVLVPRKVPAKNKAPPNKENKKGILHNNNSVQLSSGKVARKRSQVSVGPTKEIGPNNPDLNRMMSDVEMDGPVFRMAPPPSSLPLPSFTLRKPSPSPSPPPPPPPPMKLMRCNAEAAAVDGAATDNICMLLRLR